MAGIGVLGCGDFVLGFRLAGIRQTYIEEGTQNLEKRLNELLADESLSILVVSDTDYNSLSPGAKRRANESVHPAVISIGKLDEANIREKIKKAIGIDLYKKDKK